MNHSFQVIGKGIVQGGGGNEGLCARAVPENMLIVGVATTGRTRCVETFE